MNLRHRNRYVPDEEGDELRPGQTLRNHALEAARDMIRNTRMVTVRDWLDWTLEVTDDTGELVLVLPFDQAAEGMQSRTAEL